MKKDIFKPVWIESHCENTLHAKTTLADFVPIYQLNKTDHRNNTA